jgi:hypothetical protein
MPYTIYKTNGLKLTTVEDGTLNLTTDLQLVGKNYAGYGQMVNENLIKILENFANTSAPARPLIGQIWYDATTQKIKYYTGSKWSQLSTTNLSTNIPTDLKDGEFWFDSFNKRLYVNYNGSFVLIGPSAGGTGGDSGASGGSIGTSKVTSDTTIQYDVIKLQVNDTVEAVVSPFSFNVDPGDPLITQYTKVKNGITLQGSNPVTGVSSSTNMYFWGTAADALRVAGRPASDYLLSADVNVAAGNITTLGHITFISSGSPSTPGYIEGAWQLTEGSTLETTYADLAERYHADAVYEPGTVLVIGGDYEVTISTNRCDPSIAGIVSTNPAFKLNSDAGTDETHPYIALKGRVPCKVIGNIKKGDLLITSAMPGVACAMTNPDLSDPNAIIGKALQDYSSELPGIIEVKV